MPNSRRGTNSTIMSFKLIQGLFYSEHNMKGKFDNKRIIEAVKEVYDNPEVGKTSFRPKNSHPHHTFYEDVNLPEDVYNKFVLETQTLINDVCKTDTFSVEDVWGHILKPGQETTVHAHRSVGGLNEGLAWCYYPHMKKDFGNFHFIADVGGNRVIHEVECKSSHLYIFSRNVLHFTPINATKEDRISISGNFNTDWSFLDNVTKENNIFKYIGQNCAYDSYYN